MHYCNKDIGSFGETIAADYIKNCGYIILEKNFRCKLGEIDIIAKDKNFIVFIEVKTRYGCIYGSPSEAITFKKQNKIYKTAQLYIIKKAIYNKFYFRFDVIEVILNTLNSNYSVKLIKNAFQI
ncbi:YraN family protein [Clostridium sporogenes]|uniref:YraN family protein n=1 Tax=Clostridium sporogenes TaxID=1509 RepID=UPI003F91219A